MANIISLAAQPRDADTKLGALRRAGGVPGVMYGRGTGARSIRLDQTAVAGIVRTAGMSRLISLAIEGDDAPHSVFMREAQRHPVTDQILHVDLYRVVEDELIRNSVPLVMRGTPPIQETFGATVSLALSSIELEGLPSDLPATVIVDVSMLTGLSMRVSVGDLPLPENVTLLTPADQGVLQISVPRGLTEEEEAAEAAAAALVEGLVEGEGEGEGEGQGLEGAEDSES